MANHFLSSESLSKQLKLNIILPNLTIGAVEFYHNLLILAGIYHDEITAYCPSVTRQQTEKLRSTVVPVYRDFLTSTFGNCVSNSFVDFIDDGRFYVYMFFEQNMSPLNQENDSNDYEYERNDFNIQQQTEAQMINQHLQTMTQAIFCAPCTCSTYKTPDKIIMRVCNLQSNYYHEIDSTQTVAGIHLPAYNLFMTSLLKKLLEQTSEYLLRHHGLAVTASFVDMDIANQDLCMSLHYKHHQ